MPHRIYGQHLAYMFHMPTTQVWRRLYDQGRLSPPQTFFWEPKPAEELYDLQSDPDEVRNLAASAEHTARSGAVPARAGSMTTRDEMRDVGFLPEYALHRLAERDTPYDVRARRGALRHRTGPRGGQ